MKNWIIGATALAVLIGGWEMLARAAMSQDKATQFAVVGLMYAKGCPDIPEAMSQARATLFQQALTNPHYLPPWRVVYALMINGPNIRDKEVSDDVCNMILLNR